MTGFLKTTMIGGILFLVPFAVLAVILGKVVPFAQKLADPLAELIPFESVVGFDVPVLLALVLIFLFCFLVGLLAKTRAASLSKATRFSRRIRFITVNVCPRCKA